MGGLRHPHSRVAPGSPMWRYRAAVWVLLRAHWVSCFGASSGWLRAAGRAGAGGLTGANWGRRLLCPSPQREGSRSPRSPQASASLAMNLEPPKAEIRSATRVTGGPVTPRKGPPKFKQRQTRQFKSKPPKKGVQG